jgi:Fe(3+) dicitrate transport protein
MSRTLIAGASLLLFFYLPVTAWAQQAGIQGTVHEKATGSPIEAVNVIVRGTTVGASTGADGRFVIERLNPGIYTVTASAVGYAADEREVTIRDRERAELHFVLSPARLYLPNVEVAGKATSVQRSTGMLSVLSTADLRLASPLGTEEVLRKVPGVHISTDDGNSNRTNIGIRGTYPRRSERILLLEDGVPIQPALYVAPSAYYNPPAERIDAIEVIKNSSNIRFGANTVGGVVNYVTRRPPLDPSGTLRLTAGKFGYFSGFAAYGGTREDQRLGGEIQALYTRGDGQRENTSFDIYNLTGKGLYRFGGTTTVSFKGNYHREDAFATYSALTPYMFEIDARQNPFSDDFLATERFAGDMNLQSVLGRDAILTATAYGNAFQRHWWRQASEVVDARLVDPSAPEGSMIRRGRQENRARLRDFYVFGLAPRVLVNARTGVIAHELEAGLRLHTETFLDVEIDTNTPDARPADFQAASYTDLADPAGRKRKNDEWRATSVAAYAQNRIAFGALSLTPGLRVEQYTQQRIRKYDLSARQDIFDEAENSTLEILPALGFTYDLSNVSLFGGAHSAFVPLTSSSAFADLVDDAGVTVNADLRSERSLNLELGVRTSTYLPLQIEAAYFNNTFRNLIAAGRDAGFRPIIDNLGSVRYQGLETAATLDIHRLVALPLEASVDGSLTLLRSEILQGIMNESGSQSGIDITGNRAPYAPELLYTIGFTARTAAGFQARATYNFVGEQFADFNNTVQETAQGDNGLLPSYGFLDASLRYSVRGTGLTVLLAGKNLTNEVYRGSRMHRSASGIFVGGFRQINAGIEWNF